MLVKIEKQTLYPLPLFMLSDSLSYHSRLFRNSVVRGQKQGFGVSGTQEASPGSESHQRGYSDVMLKSLRQFLYPRQGSP